ncbi:amino acid ABC transporter ATP-binding protein [Castellaniella defragrans]|uniref:Amino acid ABC transporter, ATP-binding protein n=1 Tax=Castellaniella defragrans (strain DSM 12143 / CCUG 39792 / 65Phen) TaxID=1437824 RepID=W8WWY4_CASD6|nr:amino acid ABC transporter ATP-binding protein [Castellaniella defragrans]CDM24084.1 amino acid ABC transporter, ATP-binding protein [Castellaniella defragrans 65Phen]
MNAPLQHRYLQHPRAEDAPAVIDTLPAEDAPAVIDIRGLNKWYGDYHALRDIDLRVRQGDRVVLCGPSGSGKSSLIRCINRLEEAQYGRIEVLGADLMGAASQAAPVLRDVGMVFQHFNLFPHLTVMDNCTLAPLSVRGLRRREAQERACHFLDKVGMRAHLHKYPAQLSGGQQQRVAIARALCMEPKIILFDEPTAALDPEMVKEVLDVMVQLADSGVTMLCVTHEMGFARQVAGRVLFLDEGRIVEDGDPAAFFTRPRSDRARAFLRQILA